MKHRNAHDRGELSGTRVGNLHYTALAVLLAALALQPGPVQARTDCTGLSTEDCERVTRVSAIRNQNDKTDKNRIVGGSPASDADAKWTVALAIKQSNGSLRQYCGGTLVSKRWVVTAAHCDVRKGEVTVIGRKKLSETGTGVDIPIKTVINHSSYARAMLCPSEVLPLAP